MFAWSYAHDILKIVLKNLKLTFVAEPAIFSCLSITLPQVFSFCLYLYLVSAAVNILGQLSY